MAENVGADLLQKVIGSCVDKLPTMHKQVWEENISREQLEFITAISSSLADTVVTAIRVGELKPSDIADLILKRAAATIGITTGNSTAARGTKITFALASFALTSWELYGSLVTMSASMGTAAVVAEGAAAVGAAAASPAAVAGITIIGVLYWTYLLADTIISAEKTSREVEAEIPARFNIAGKRAAIMNMISDNTVRLQPVLMRPGWALRNAWT